MSITHIVLLLLVVVLIFGLTTRVRIGEGPVAALPSHAPPGGAESDPVIRNVYVPAGVEPDVVTLRVVVTSALVVWTGLIP